jgi:lipopolysaccharide transport system ATP-binding protein
MSSEVAIRVSGISKCYQIYESPKHRLLQMLYRGRKSFYREFWALRDISFEVKRGETFAIIGRNGSGKSTLLQLICGTLSPTSGSIEVNGRVAALLELGAGFNPEFTGRENVYMSAALYGLSSAEVDARFKSIADFADIGDHLEQPVKTYSSGMYVRLAFAVIAHVDADILVIDEALAVGDAFFTQKCMRFLREFMESGTLLFVSHDTSSVVNLCEKALWLERGVSKGIGSSKQVTEQYLQALYEAQQGVASGGSTQKASKKQKNAVCQYKDQRLEYINASNLRNDLEVFNFNPDENHFGLQGATITDVRLISESREKLLWIVGGENVILEVEVEAHQDLTNPIVGFLVKDKLGQILFGENTYLTLSGLLRPVDAGATLVASFEFSMPILPRGDYSITVAIADGTQENHVQHQWIHDALLIKSHSSSVTTGLLGVPMKSISIIEEAKQDACE